MYLTPSLLKLKDDAVEAGFEFIENKDLWFNLDLRKTVKSKNKKCLFGIRIYRLDGSIHAMTLPIGIDSVKIKTQIEMRNYLGLPK